MGSDSTEKSDCRRSILRRHFPLTARTCFFVILLVAWKTSRESSFTSFEPQDTSHLPDRCLELSSKFHHCQGNTDKAPVVFACHRKWCQSYGHCEPCAGIGDRTLHVLSLVEEALERCIPVQLDYPLPAIQIVSNAIYEDPLWFQSLLHQRSYDVTPRTVNAKEWGTKKSFVHFEPTNYSFKGHDTCLFHILFRPVPAVQKEIDDHRQKMGKNVIGIHFRSGDSSAFGTDNKDVRATDIPLAFSKMLSCGEELATRLFPPSEPYTFFLATDNKQAKELASCHKSDRFTIYQTETPPSSYLRADGKRDAWVELYLLSMMRGLVVNVRPKHYEGKALRLSLFSILAKRIGDIKDNAVIECSLD
jgi:hypothetical protein